MKRYVFLAVAVLIAAASCTKTYEVGTQSEGMPIALGTWNDVMTRAPKNSFVTNDEFDVFGYKWNDGPANETTVFNGDDVKFDGSKWTYEPIRFWDANFDHYTFYAVYPKDQLSASDAQTGIFTSNEQNFSTGAAEPLLVAQKKTVDNAAYGSPVQIVFKHTSSLLNLKFKKHPNLEDAVVTVSYVALDSLLVAGSYTNVSYDANNNPIGAQVSSVDSLGWTPAATPVYNDSSATAFKKTSEVALAADTGTDVATAGSLIDSLIVMPQILNDTGNNKQQITITYSITTGTAPNEQTVTYQNKTIDLALFDLTDPAVDGNSDGNPDNDNTAPYIARWRPGVCYTYYITINANGIEFTASIDPWTTETVAGHHYLIN